MSIEFNHTLVHAKDTWAAAREVGRVLGLAEPSSYGPFAVLQFDNGATLDFIEDTGEIKAQHYAFLVGEDDFDAIWDRLKEQGRQWWADPHKRRPGRSTTRTAAAASTGKDPTATGWRSSPARMAAGAEGPDPVPAAAEDPRLFRYQHEDLQSRPWPPSGGWPQCLRWGLCPDGTRDVTRRQHITRDNPFVPFSCHSC